MTKIIYNKPIYVDGVSETFEVLGAESIKLQGIGTGVYTLKGKLSKECGTDTICMIKASDFQKTSTVSDTSIYIGDISGYTEITVEASGFDKIWASVIG